MDATFEAEEAQHLAEISKKLNEEHRETLRRNHRELMTKVSTYWTLGSIVMY